MMTFEQADQIYRCCCNTNKLLAIIAGLLRGRPRRPATVTTRVITTVAVGEVLAPADPNRVWLALSSQTNLARASFTPTPTGFNGWAPGISSPLVFTTRDQCDLATMEWVNQAVAAATWTVVMITQGCFDDTIPTPSEQGMTSGGPSLGGPCLRFPC